MTLSFEIRHTVDFKALLLDVLIFSVPVWLLLQLFRTKRPRDPATVELDTSTNSTRGANNK